MMGREDGAEADPAAIGLGDDWSRLGTVDDGGLVRRRVDQQVRIVVGELGDGDDFHAGSILHWDPRGLRFGIDARGARNRRALLEAEKPFAQSRALDRAGELLLREIAEPALEPGEPIAQSRGLARARDLLLAAFHHPALDPGESLAQRAELAQFGPHFAPEVGEPLLHALEALPQLVRVQRLPRGIT